MGDSLNARRGESDLPDVLSGLRPVALVGPYPLENSFIVTFLLELLELLIEALCQFVLVPVYLVLIWVIAVSLLPLVWVVAFFIQMGYLSY